MKEAILPKYTELNTDADIIFKRSKCVKRYQMFSKYTKEKKNKKEYLFRMG